MNTPIRIALIGPDGTGKSTIARRLVTALPSPAKYIYMGINVDASNVMLPTTWLLLVLRKIAGKHQATQGGPPPISKPRKRGVRGWLASIKSLVRMMHLMADEWFRQLVCWFWQRCGYTIIMDRHYLLDYYAYDVQPRYGKPTLAGRIHGWMLRHIYPRPDFVLFLDADGKLLFQRKGEGTVEQLQRRRKEYLAARELFPKNSAVINAAGSPDDVLQQSIAAVLRFMSQTGPQGIYKTQPNHAPAVIVGLDCYTGLQTARILARRGIPVIGVAANRKHFACRTRACRTIVTAPTRSEELISKLEELGAQLGQRAVLIPCIDMSVLLISQHRQRLEQYYYIALPDEECVRTLIDKVEFHRFAQRNGLLVPKTFTIRSRDDAAVAAVQLTFPCILKPSIKTDCWEQTIKTKVFRVSTADELSNLAERLTKISPQLTVQEWIEGDDEHLFTCNCYFSKDSRALVTFVTQKLRQWPPEMGVGSLGQECRNDEVELSVVQLFQSAGFHGLGYAEVKRHRDTGKYYFIEANIGRPTGRSAMAEAAGVELLQTMYCELLGLPLPTARQQKYLGMKWIYWRKDIRAAIWYWRRGALSVMDWWRSIRGKRVDAVFAWSDPVPFFFDVFGAAGKTRAKPAKPVATPPAELVQSGAADQ